jgi:membrane associated rhomboid family serine protease
MPMSLPPPPVLEHCYRHPDRETGRRCTRCGKPACGECLVQVSVGSQCLDCIRASRPDARTRARYWNARQPTLITYALIIINFAVFLWTTSANDRLELVPGQRGGVGHGDAKLGLYKPFVHDGDWYRLVSSGFLHFGIFHIAMNMLLLYQLGQLLEPAIGRLRFSLMYFASLLGGSFGALILQPNAFSGGASGAVFGLLAGSAMALHRRGVNVMQTGIGMVLILNLVITFTIRNISYGGHVGGAVVGAICAFVMFAPRHRPIPEWVTYATPIVLGGAAFILSVAVSG